MPAIPTAESLLGRAGALIEAAKVLGLTTFLTEQYTRGLGPTVSPIRSRLDQAVQPDEKLVFSALTPAIRRALNRGQIDQVLVCGVETHVCVLQTCLELCESGWHAFVATDACGSRREFDHQAALRRMEQVGIIPTTVESAILEMVQAAGTDSFKAILPLLKTL
ncbi:MAG: isochorismatase family protein [Phycisphaeraceae bacterium]|nr:isochorismatase family protein [Phycisphaeraceae bacterium]